jgi:hypothetical protein
MRGAGRPFSLLAVASALVLAVGAGSVLASDSPNGDQAGAWPASWRTYLLSDGDQVHDMIGDVGCGSGYCDVSSGGSGGRSSVYFASNGVDVFFRLRLKGDPRDASHGGFGSTAYVIQIAVNRVARVAVGLNGKTAHRDFVYVSNADGTVYSEVYAYPFNTAGGELSYGARAVADGTGHYLLDFQVPLARITQRSGGMITGSTPVQLFFGTSQSANLAVINKDFMVGDSVDFGHSSTVTLVPQPDPQPAPQQGPGQPPAPASSNPPAQGGAPEPPLLPNTATPERPVSWPILLGAAAVVTAWTQSRARRRRAEVAVP